MMPFEKKIGACLSAPFLRFSGLAGSSSSERLTDQECCSPPPPPQTSTTLGP